MIEGRVKAQLNKFNLIFFAIALLLFLIILLYNPVTYGIYADQSTHLIQSQSLAFDGDLKFENNDLVRFQEDGWEPIGLFVKYSNGEYYYAKPILYSLFSAPFVRLFGIKGPIILNSIFFCLLLYLTFSWLKYFNQEKKSLIFVLLFFFFSVAPVYIFIIHPDLTIATLLCISLYFWFTGEKVSSLSDASESKKSKYRNQEVYILLSSAFFGLAIYEKLPLVFFFCAMCISFILKKKVKVVLLSVLLASIFFMIPTSVHLMQDGNYSAYKGNRFYSLNPAELISGKNTEEAGQLKKASGDKFFTLEGIFNAPGLKLIHLNAVYFIVGRQTGLLPYFVGAVICLFIFALSSYKKEKIYLLAAILAYVVFYFVLTPENYFGGATSLGNRYALQIIPSFLFLINYLPKNNKILAFYSSIIVLWGTLFLGPILANPFGKIKQHVQIIRTFPFTLLPMGLTQIGTAFNDDPSGIIKTNSYKIYKLNKNFDSPSRGSNFVIINGEYGFVVESPEELSSIRALVKNKSYRQNKLFVDTVEEEWTLQPFETRILEIELKNCKRIEDVFFYNFQLNSHTEVAILIDENEVKVEKDLYIDIGTSSAANHIVSGWYNNEVWLDSHTFQWAGPSAEAFARLDPDESYKLTFRAFSHIDFQKTKIFINENFVGEVKLKEGWNEYSVVIPQEALKNGLAFIRMEHLKSQSPSSGSSNDERLLSTAYDWLHLQSLNNLKGRND